MIASTRSLLASLLMLGSGLGSFDALLAHYAQAHFGPNQTLRSALSAGDGCVVTIGDSRIAAGVDPVALAGALDGGAEHACVANLGIGAVGIAGQSLALRRYLSAPRSPRLVVIGGGPLLPVDATDPSEMAGNVAAELAWSRPSDVDSFFPGFPLHHLDPGLRFSIARATALQSYASLLWGKVQAIQGNVVGTSRSGPSNRFGLVEDMQALAVDFATQASAQLQRWDGHWQEDPWFQTIRDMAHAKGVKLVVVHIPVRAVYRRQVNDTELWKSYQAWLRDDLAKGGDAYVDLSTSLDDSFLEDGVHADPEGARIFSQALGRTVTPYLAP